VGLRLPSGAPAEATPVRTLLEAPPGAFAVAVDIEAHEPPVMRFSTGAVGLAPPLGTDVTATYEVGGGSVGNVPANALRELELGTAGPDGTVSWSPVEGVGARNPAPAAGGADPMPLDVARRDAPEAFAVEPRRAVLPLDHAEMAARDPLVERAMARRGWSGSWPLVTTVVDLRAREEAAAASARAGLAALLDDVRMLGTEAAVVEGTAVGLLIAMEICARPGADPESVRREVLALLRPGSDERPGLFHPSRLALGGAVYLSAVQAAAAAPAGVDAVEVTEARRLSEPPGTVNAVIALAPDEVAVLDDDPARPERGRLDVRVRGGG
jgi:predicted phage baseplate assembly protein